MWALPMLLGAAACSTHPGACSNAHRKARLVHTQVVEALWDGRAAAAVGAPPQPLRDVRLRSVVTAVRLLPGGVGVEVEVEGQVRRGGGGGCLGG